MAGSHVPNVALRRLLAETGWTEEQLARAVNAAGAETGIILRYDRSAVSHWLAGRWPWGPVPALLAETLSRGLGRAITVADIEPGAADRPGTDQDVPAVLTRLADFSGDRRYVAACGAYSVAALALPDWAQAVLGVPARPPRKDTPRKDTPRKDAPRRLTAGQVDAVEQMTGLFTDADAAFGGGRARTALAAYLAYDVAPCLQATASSALRGRMLAVATQLTYLCAFMCFDDEQHALAQRYYRAALDLAAENSDPAAYAIGLRALSVQARTLGHPRPARALAEAAASTGRAKFPPGRQAFLLGQVAVAAAGDGDRAGAISSLAAAERLLSQAGSAASHEPGSALGAAMGSYHPAALAHQQAAVCALLGDRAGAISALSVSIRHRPSGERRSRAITTARLAELQLAQGHLEEAVATWHSFLDDYPHLQSGRMTAALATLRSQLRPHGANNAAGRLLTRAAALRYPAGALASPPAPA